MFDFENLRWNWKTFVAVLATESGILVLALLGSALFEADYHFPRAAIAILNALMFTVVVSTLYVRVKLVEKQFGDAAATQVLNAWY